MTRSDLSISCTLYLSRQEQRREKPPEKLAEWENVLCPLASSKTFPTRQEISIFKTDLSQNKVLSTFWSHKNIRFQMLKFLHVHYVWLVIYIYNGAQKRYPISVNTGLSYLKIWSIFQNKEMNCFYTANPLERSVNASKLNKVNIF